ncbi:MAG TPA: high-affinity branched-chain amino acid ABC transporter permease LivM [Stellaceae bacterium]|nr:high-affinity branched-chain amino acid ABC transporter permease LivM [Stellaceae bacterium]
MAVQAIAAARPGAVPSALKEAGLAALVAFVLALPLVGLQTVDSGGGALGIATHFDRVAYGVAAVFLGRLALIFWRGRRQSRPADAPSVMARVSELSARFSLPIAVVGIALAIGLPFMPFASRYVVDLGTTVLIYVMLGWGLNVVVGLAGLLDLGYVAFYAVGAYSFGLLARTFGFGFWEALPLAGAFAASFGIILGFPVLRLRGDYLAIVTLGFGEIIRIVLTNWSNVTGGPNGIGNIPRPTFFGLPFERNAPHGGLTFSKFFGIDFTPDHRVWALYFIILMLALLTNFFTLRIRRLPVGRAWEALREDEVACRALGINATNVKLSAFAIGAMFGGFAGCFFGARQGFISPESFNFIQSAIILAIVVLGGMGSQTGVVLAALVLVCIPELGRDLADFRMLAFGAAMVGIMIWRPRGLLAHRAPTVRLHRRGDPVPAPAGAAP